MSVKAQSYIILYYMHIHKHSHHYNNEDIYKVRVKCNINGFHEMAFQLSNSYYYNKFERQSVSSFEAEARLSNSLYKNSVRTAMKTQLLAITKINWLTLFKEIIAVYSDNHTKPINTKRRVLDC
jgi:hypothetical protein